MADGINMDGFSGPKINPTPVWNGVQYAANPASAFPAKDMSTQGNAGFNAEGSYDMGNRRETNMYPESENM